MQTKWQRKKKTRRSEEFLPAGQLTAVENGKCSQPEEPQFT